MTDVGYFGIGAVVASVLGTAAYVQRVPIQRLHALTTREFATCVLIIMGLAYVLWPLVLYAMAQDRDV